LSKPWILVLADDLTGALEVGAKFTGRGLSSKVTTDLAILSQPQTDVLVIDTETRHVSEGKAYRIIHDAALAASHFPSLLIYKKTDSTLRGNIAAEFRALQAVFPDRPLIYVPAYPEMGRTVKNGRLYVWGKLLHETEFANDLLNPTRESDLLGLLNNETVAVLDGESSEDIAAAVQMITRTNPLPLAAGPAALAGALAESFGVHSVNGKELPPIKRCLVVNGSLHPMSFQQVSFAHERGCFAEEWTWFDHCPEGDGLVRARLVGERVREILEESAFDGLVVFGGDTAFGIHSALGGLAFESLGEILPGVPLSRCGGLFWITKAGGFGEADILHKIQRLLI